MKRIVLLTPLMLQSIKIKPKEYALYDAACDGLALRVQPSGAISWVVWENHNGKTRRITLGRFDALDLDAARQLARTRLLGGPDTPVTLIRERTIRFDQLAEQFLEAKRGVYTPASHKTLAIYLNTQLLPALGSIPVGGIKTAQVADWFYGYSRSSPGGANQAIGYFTTLLNWGKEHGHLPADLNNPASPIKRNRRAARGRLLNSEQLRDLARVLNNPPSRNRNAADAILIILLTGCRSGEIIRLKWSEVKKTRLTLTHTKTGPRDVLLTDTVIERLRRRKIGSSSPYVFPSMTNPNRPLTSLDGSWRSIKTKAGLPDDIRLHDLRHTYASHAIMSGETLAITGRLLGHKTPRSTEVYAHLEAKHLARAADKVASMVVTAMGR